MFGQKNYVVNKEEFTLASQSLTSRKFKQQNRLPKSINFIVFQKDQKNTFDSFSKREKKSNLLSDFYHYFIYLLEISVKILQCSCIF